MLTELAEKHRFKVLGGLGGLVVALLIMRLSFWWTVFVLFCGGFGFWLGKRLDEGPESFAEALERLLPPGGRT